MECNICKKGEFARDCKNTQAKSNYNRPKGRDVRNEKGGEAQNLVSEHFTRFDDSDNGMYYVDHGKANFEKIKLNLAVASKVIEFEMDTGSPMSAISYDV